MGRRRRLRAAWVVGLALLTASCSGTSKPDRPNILWIVWDTVRADHLSLYGHDRPTTPFLDRWAADARVFTDCVSTAGSTVPSHASMFTGLMPTEHGTHNRNRKLDPNFTTVAELLSHAGYQTYLFSANPHIQQKMGFDQGFDVHEHPWSDDYREEAIRIVERKTEGDRSSLLPRRVRAGDIKDWYIKAAGELAGKGLMRWLQQRDRSRPYFAFLNYMEAHSPYIPPRELREKMMSPDRVARSYEIDNSHLTRWAYTFGVAEMTDEDLEILRAVYDASILELDTLLEQLLTDLEREGALDDTIVILVADHGEHLGEHHLLDHQYALYDPIIRVPLIVHYPERFAAGRDDSPTVTYDIFPTILELSGAPAPAGLHTKAVSLTRPRRDRVRMAEYPVVFEPAIRDVRRIHSDWDFGSWRRLLRSLYDGDYKLICGSDGRHELYDLARDPGETHDLYANRTELAEGMMARLEAFADTLIVQSTAGGRDVELSDEERRMLISLGYMGENDDPGALAVDPSSTGACGF